MSIEKIEQNQSLLNPQSLTGGKKPAKGDGVFTTLFSSAKPSKLDDKDITDSIDAKDAKLEKAEIKDAKLDAKDSIDAKTKGKLATPLANISLAKGKEREDTLASMLQAKADKKDAHEKIEATKESGNKLQDSVKNISSDSLLAKASTKDAKLDKIEVNEASATSKLASKDAKLAIKPDEKDAKLAIKPDEKDAKLAIKPDEKTTKLDRLALSPTDTSKKPVIVADAKETVSKNSQDAQPLASKIAPSKEDSKATTTIATKDDKEVSKDALATSKASTKMAKKEGFSLAASNAKIAKAMHEAMIDLRAQTTPRTSPKEMARLMERSRQSVLDGKYSSHVPNIFERPTLAKSLALLNASPFSHMDDTAEEMQSALSGDILKSILNGDKKPLLDSVFGGIQPSEYDLKYGALSHKSLHLSRSFSTHDGVVKTNASLTLNGVNIPLSKAEIETIANMSDAEIAAMNTGSLSSINLDALLDKKNLKLEHLEALLKNKSLDSRLKRRVSNLIKAYNKNIATEKSALAALNSKAAGDTKELAKLSEMIKELDVQNIKVEDTSTTPRQKADEKPLSMDLMGMLAVKSLAKKKEETLEKMRDEIKAAQDKQKELPRRSYKVAHTLNEINNAIIKQSDSNNKLLNTIIALGRQALASSEDGVVDDIVRQRHKKEKKDIASLNANFEFSYKSAQARQSVQGFSNALAKGILEYKPPITKLTLDLNPRNLGSIEVTIQKQGKDLKVSLNGSAQSMALFAQNQDAFKANLQNLGFNDVSFSFDGKDGGSKGNQGDGGQNGQNAQDQNPQSEQNTQSEQGSQNMAQDRSNGASLLRENLARNTSSLDIANNASMEITIPSYA